MESPERLHDPRWIRSLLARHGLHASRRLGQNFLCDPHIPEAIVDGAGIDASHIVLEIGPGLGALTRALSRAAGRVVAVEADSALRPVLGETLCDCGNVAIVWGDILKTDIPALMEEHAARGQEHAARGQEQSARGKPPLVPVVCANLPYNVGTKILRRLLDTDLFAHITVMVQREVALRLRASAGDAAYGAMTIHVGTRAACEILFDVPPESFVPAPKVTSSVVRLTRRKLPLRHPDLFSRIVRAAFAQRRKTLPNALSTALPIPKTRIQDALAACGLPPMARGETLDIAAFDILSDTLFTMIGG
ncbi:MAG: 16S rRNA (adenine(1518)-N(6)/adenine(1519)-N(6))-dimethyltransferase RsmA [Oscillospiraceae bacterium]|nr:16S rRNA (adenine(1518)-N(6)/adenine(1519)-N(6))-dimethyltransferase RsmA [Oscillospiraceae bacterium]